MRYAFRFPQRSLDWGLFRVPNDDIISANGVGSDMLTRIHPRRSNEGSVASVAPKKLAWALILMGALGSRRRDAIRTKAVPAHPSSSPKFRRRHKVDERESTRSLVGSETLDQSSRLLFMRTAGNGGCSPGLIIPSFPSKQTRRGGRKLISDLRMLRYWRSRIIIRCPGRMWLGPKAVPLSRDHCKGSRNAAICPGRIAYIQRL
jgi:hypothetical protein